jgi:hypothetical protein
MLAAQEECATISIIAIFFETNKMAEKQNLNANKFIPENTFYTINKNSLKL